MGFSYPEGLGMISLARKGTHSQRKKCWADTGMFVTGQQSSSLCTGVPAVRSLEAMVRAHLCGAPSVPVVLSCSEQAHLGLFTSSGLVHPGPPNRASLPM